MKKNTKWYFLVTLVFLIWGTQHPPIKIISNELPPFLFNFLRFFIASLVLLPIIIYKKLIPNKQDLFKIAALGIVGIALYGIFVAMGIKLSTSTNSAILINANPIFIAILAPLLIGEIINAQKIIGVLMGFLGVLIVISNDLNIGNIIKSEYFIGNLLLLLAALCVAIFAIYNKSFIKKYDGLSVTFYAVASGTIVLFLLSTFNGELTQLAHISIHSMLLVSYVAIITTALTWVIWFNAIKKIGVISTSAFFFIIPISGIFSSYLWLNEKITFYTIIGAILIIIGIYIVQRQNITSLKS